MYFQKEFSDYNDDIAIFKKPNCEDYNLKKSDVEAVYKEINKQSKKITYEEKYYTSAPNDFSYFVAFIFVAGFCIGSFINKYYILGVIGILGTVSLFFVRNYLKARYEEEKEKKLESYKSLSQYDENMNKFMLVNDEYYSKISAIKDPILLKMEKVIKTYNYQSLKNIIIESYTRLGYKVYSTGIRKFGGVILRISDDIDYNKAILIFPYDNPISGQAISNLKSITNKIAPCDHLDIIAKHDIYLFSSYMHEYLFFPHTLYNAYSLAELIWRANSNYYSKGSKAGYTNQNKNDYKNNISNFENKLSDEDVLAKCKLIIKENTFKKINSSYLQEVLYCKINKVLFVKFNNNQVYAYFDVDEKIYKVLEVIDSPGSYFIKNIKNKYKVLKILF